jgi:cell division protein FtsI (penicillin-binding protein 3)
MPSFSPNRAAAVLIVVIAAFVALVGRVAYLQTYGRERTIRQAERQQHQMQVLPARPGCIYDRNGILMAGTVETRTLYIDPRMTTAVQDSFPEDGKQVAALDDSIDTLSKLIHRKPAELSQLFSNRSDARFLRIAEGLDDATADAITKLNLPGTGIISAPRRFYPMAPIAVHLLGSVRKDGVGLEGLELSYAKELAGKDGFECVLKDSHRRPIGVAAEDYQPPQHGEHLILTIDANIQTIAEEELEKTCTLHAAVTGEVVVMDPRNGEVLALANWPKFDPAHEDPKRPEIRRNRAITDRYEPGSTIKPFIVGPALQWGVTRPEEVFHTGGSRYHTPYGRTISDVHGYEDLCLWDVLVKSSNIGMSMLGERLGNHRLYTALTGWHFGQPTGVELPGEVGGTLHDLKHWDRRSTESVSQGYELTVTPMQLCRAFCAYANGGRLVTPHIVKSILDASGNVQPGYEAVELTDQPQIVSPQTAALVKRILADVPLRGTAENLGVKSTTWNIFGKTGTAYISEGKRGYSTSRYHSSFVAGAPAESPRLVIAFVVHDPKKDGHFGGAVAGPGASQVLQRSLAYLQVPPSPDLPMPPDDVIPVLQGFKPEKQYARTPDVVASAEK